MCVEGHEGFGGIAEQIGPGLLPIGRQSAQRGGHSVCCLVHHFDSENDSISFHSISTLKMRRVFVSKTFSLLHLKNLFEEMDDDHNGYLDEEEFCAALKSVNSGLMHLNRQQQRHIFQKLAIRRVDKRVRVYFYDFFKNTASVENKEREFDITQVSALWLPFAAPLRWHCDSHCKSQLFQHKLIGHCILVKYLKITNFLKIRSNVDFAVARC